MNEESIEFEYPDGYDDEAWIWEAKGFIYVDALVGSGDVYTIFLIDPMRLQQETIGTTIEKPYFESNLVVVPSTTRENIELAIRRVLKDSERLLARKPVANV